MPQIIGTTTEESNGTFTKYSGTATEVSQNFTFSKAQNGMHLSNKGDSILELTVDGKTHRIPSRSSINVDDKKFSSFDIKAKNGSSDFFLTSFSLKGSDVDTAALDDINAQLAQTVSAVGEIVDSANSSDDTTLLQNKINAGAGKVVTFPKGNATYIVSASITIPSNTTIDLGGNTIKQKVGTNLENGLLFVASGSSNVYIKNGTIDIDIGNQTYTQPKTDFGRGIFAYNSSNVRINNVKFKNPYGAMILFAAITGGEINNCDFSDVNGTGTDAIALNGCSDVRVHHNTGTGKVSVTGYGVHAYGNSSYIKIYRNKMKYYQIVALGENYFNADGTPFGSSNMLYVSIDDNEIIEPSADSSIHFGLYGSFSRNKIIKSGDMGISCDYSRKLVINDNVINETNIGGIAVPGANDCVINNNIILNAGSQWKYTTTNNGSRTGIWIPAKALETSPLVYPAGNIISGNTISFTITPSTMYYGVSVVSTGANQTNGTNLNVVKGNFVFGATEKSIDIPPQTATTGHQGFDDWTAPTLLNSWVNSDAATYNSAGFKIDETGKVVVRGLVASGTIGTVIFNLPAGYRPSKKQLLWVLTDTGIGRLDIWMNGDVVLSTGGTGFVSLDNISFYLN